MEDVQTSKNNEYPETPSLDHPSENSHPQYSARGLKALGQYKFYKKTHRA